MANKVLPILGGVLLFCFLPLIVVIALILGGMGSMDAMAQNCPPPENSASMSWPTDLKEVSRDFTQIDPQTGYTHDGVDFDVKAGSKVYAVADGKITSVADNQVIIRHDKGVETRYKFMQSIKVKVNDEVKRGDQIGTSGSGNETGGMSGEHLHFELWIDKDGTFENTRPEDGTFGDDTTSTGGGGCGCGGGDLSGNNNVQKVFNYFVSNGYSKEQAAGVIGNMQTESYVEPTMKQGDSPGQVTHPDAVANSGGGWGLVQWTPASQMIQVARGSGADDKTIESLEFQLEFLKTQLDGKGPMAKGVAGTALHAAKTVAEATYAFGHKFEAFRGHETEGTDNWRKRIADAQQAFDQYAGSATGGDGASACGAGSGNIAAVAKSLAWPSTGHDTMPYANAATDAYKANFYKYNKSAKAAGDVGWTDCGRFVATVMHMSGADPDYPDVYTPTQENYLRTSGKYDVHDDWDASKLEPGDILIGPGHTYLFVGPWADGHNSASASLDGDAPGPGHVPEASNAYEIGTTYAIARLKK
ncbi:phage tail tip lysozyme [Kribbella sp. NPDC051952]|uniref:phage tail tip lysozyme n=1 Tax=Kribbella sp. NPDC051952 TaxID=3154851 RepID=UPI00341CAF20